MNSKMSQKLSGTFLQEIRQFIQSQTTLENENKSLSNKKKHAGINIKNKI